PAAEADPSPAGNWPATCLARSHRIDWHRFSSMIPAPREASAMADNTKIHRTVGEQTPSEAAPGDSCLGVIFGASGGLTKRLPLAAFYNLACGGLLPRKFAIAGIALDGMSTEQFRARMTADIRQFNTRPDFDAKVWEDFVGRLYYTPGNFSDPEAYKRLADLVGKLEADYQTGGNILFYMATPPPVFGLISTNLDKAGFKKRAKGWVRIVVEKPFGHDLASAIELNRTLLAHWSEEQIY